jgi:hypothetical protein
MFWLEYTGVHIREDKGTMFSNTRNKISTLNLISSDFFNRKQFEAELKMK